MNDRDNLHEYEQLLASVGPAKAVLWLKMLRALPAMLIVTAVIILIIWFGVLFPLDLTAYGAWLALIIPIVFGLAFQQMKKKWSKARLRITTERILLEYKSSIDVRPVVPPQNDAPKSKTYSLVTIKWSQYQESSLPSAGVLEKLLGAQPIALRYGSADGQLIALFPAVPFAMDLKHYLDKADSAVRTGQIDTLKPFVLKKSGQRD